MPELAALITYVVLRQSVSGNDGVFASLEEALALCDEVNLRDQAYCTAHGLPLPPYPDAYVERHSPLSVERVLRTPDHVILCGPVRQGHRTP